MTQAKKKDVNKAIENPRREKVNSKISTVFFGLYDASVYIENGLKFFMHFMVQI